MLSPIFGHVEVTKEGVSDYLTAVTQKYRIDGDYINDIRIDAITYLLENYDYKKDIVFYYNIESYIISFYIPFYYLQL